MTPLHQDWREFFESLLRHEVTFVLVGGLAVAAHGEPRYTEDCDVFVEPSAETEPAQMAALYDLRRRRLEPVRLGQVWPETRG